MTVPTKHFFLSRFKEEIIDRACEDACTKLVLASVTSVKKCSPGELSPRPRRPLCYTNILCRGRGHLIIVRGAPRSMAWRGKESWKFLLIVKKKWYDLHFTKRLQSWNFVTVLGCVLHAMCEDGWAHISKPLWNVDRQVHYLSVKHVLNKEASWRDLWNMIKKKVWKN